MFCIIKCITYASISFILHEIHSLQELREIIDEYNSSFPDLKDLQGCALAILRLQDVYHISAEKIADGRLSDKVLSPRMRTAHCLELGHINHHWKNYEQAYGWFMEAWKRMNSLDKSSGIQNRDVLQYLIWAEYKVSTAYIVQFRAFPLILLPERSLR